MLLYHVLAQHSQGSFYLELSPIDKHSLSQTSFVLNLADNLRLLLSPLSLTPSQHLPVSKHHRLIEALGASFMKPLPTLVALQHPQVPPADTEEPGHPHHSPPQTHLPLQEGQEVCWPQLPSTWKPELCNLTGSCI